MDLTILKNIPNLNAVCGIIYDYCTFTSHLNVEKELLLEIKGKKDNG